ncbi:hypothetical protein CDD82_4536 [Ophiocordyceps australis]|uniref:Heterokaryon incompatibility domain-containing protein n=1 Tax=Ophiocordyceps australis TaxID=1399860 RepID=A0A2C5Z056_9HYPO|nr:hypothetical protein CDD82_4536 [Ophiocordyceps australis]
MQAYRYQPLRPGEIRLLRLDALNQPDQPLSGTILHHQLTNPTFCHGTAGQPDSLHHVQSYEAISYHWGSDLSTPYHLAIHPPNNDTVPSVIPITASLEYVLRRLALPNRSRVLWADAICINQVISGANQEKGQQIQLMPDIYRIATCVQICLGRADPSDNVPTALALLRTIADYSQYLDNTEHPAGEIGTRLAAERGFVLPKPNDPCWAALRSFWRRPWFRRVWIIQEFVYAADVNIFCGHYFLDWRLLWLASKAYCDNRQLIFAGFRPDWYGRRRFDEYREAHEGSASTLHITDLRMRAWGYMSNIYMTMSLDAPEMSHQYSGLTIRKTIDSITQFEGVTRSRLLQDRALGTAFSYGRPDIMDLLTRTCNFNATQPVDRIYALLGLAENTYGIKPVYSNRDTVALVARRLAVALINDGRLSEVLALAGVRSGTSVDDAPSWVPDWTKQLYAQDKAVGFTRLSNMGQTRELRQYLGPAKVPARADKVDAEAEKAKPEDIIYNAALDTNHEFHLDEANGTLTVKVTVVDRVATVLPGQLLLGLPMYSGMAQQKLGLTYPTGESIEEALWRTLIGNLTLHGEKPSDEYATQYANLKKRELILLVRATIMLFLGLMFTLPLVIVALRRLPLFVLVGCVTMLAMLGRVALAQGVVLLLLLPVFRWLWTMCLVPALIALAWYGTVHVYPTQILELYKYLGVSAVAIRDTVPPDCTAYLMRFAIISNRYNLCFTGYNLMGLLPIATRAGDLVVIVHGCNVPFVVRPTEREGYFGLVGECYVHGVMNGECLVGQSQSLTLI